MDDLERARLKRFVERVEKRSGLDIMQLIALAFEAEANGAAPHEVRRILDGDLSPANRADPG